MNLRNYKSNTDFNGEQPWIYPGMKKFKAVVIDRSFFPKVARFNKDYTNADDMHEVKEILEKKKPKFVDKFKYRERNVAKIRHLFN